MITTMKEVKAEEMEQGALLVMFIEREYPELIPEFAEFVDDFNEMLDAGADAEDE